MSKQPISDAVRIIAERSGIGRALEMFPDAVAAAADRGLRPLPAPPAGTPSLIHPAQVFDPTRNEVLR